MAWTITVERCWTLALALPLLATGCPPGEPRSGESPDPKVTAASIGELKTILSVKLESGGVELRQGAGWVTLRPGQQFLPGAGLRTTAGVQARVALRDASVLHLNEKTQVQLVDSRRITLESGEVLVEVEPGVGGKPMLLATPASDIRVTGTKLNVKLDEKATVVDVARGTVEVAGRAGSRVEVGAGERAIVQPGAAPRVSLSKDLSDVTRWSREIGPLPGAVHSFQPGIGSLEARVPGQGASVALRLARHQVRVAVQDNVARTEVEQEYHNASNQTLEGTYRFPLPEGASISRLALYVGNRLEEGEIVERQRARQIFRQIVEDTVRPRDPALLEWVGGRTFQMKIFPIPPRGSRRVILAYTQVMHASHGRYRYEYPLATEPGRATTVGHFGIDLRAGSSAGAPQVTAPLYPVLTEADGAGVRLRFEADEFRPAASFVANISSATTPPELQLALFEPPAAQRDAACTSPVIAAAAIRDTVRRRPPSGPPVSMACGDRGGFFMAIVRPELPQEGKPQPRDYLFLLDSSYSSGARGWEVQLAALEAFLTEMDLRSRFNLLACDASCRSLGTEFRKPTAEARQAAMRFARSIVTGGSSNLQGAFEEAARLLASSDKPAQVVYFGDGRPSAGELREPELARLVVSQLERSRARLTALQIGEDVSEFFLPEATRRLAGAVYRLGPGDDVASLVFDIVAAQYRPTLTDLQVTVEDLDVHHLYPTRLESLTAGSEAVLVGRYGRGGDGAIRLQGKLDGRPFERRFPVHLRADLGERQANGFIPRLWAKHHLDALAVEGYALNRPEIVRVSKAYTVLSRATAFLVLENERMYREFGVSRQRQRNEWSGNAIAVRQSKDQPASAAKRTEIASSSEAAPAAAAATPTGDRARLAAGGMGGAPSAQAAEPAPESAKVAREESEASRPEPADDRAEPPEPEPEAKTKADGEKSAGDEQDALEDRAPNPSRPEPPAAPARRAAVAKPAPSSLGSFGGGRSVAYRPRPIPVPTVTIQPLLDVPVDAASRRSEESLRQQIAAQPLRRGLHAALHRALVRNGSYEEALRHAAQWAELDGTHADAIAALADLQLLRGQPESAMRSYGSTVDIEPWNPKRHLQLAEMYRHKAQPRLSCAHLWSLVSLAPRDVEKQLQLIRCLAALPDSREQAARLVSELSVGASPRDVSRLARALAEVSSSTPAPPRPPLAHAALTVRATWNARTDLDVVVVTPAGRIISALSGGRTAGAEQDSHDGLTPETVYLSSVPDGVYRVEVVLPRATSSGAATASSVSGTVLVQALGRAQTIPFQTYQPSRALAQVQVRVMHPSYRHGGPFVR